MKHFKTKYLLSAAILLLFGQVLIGRNSSAELLFHALQDSLQRNALISANDTTLSTPSLSKASPRSRRARNHALLATPPKHDTIRNDSLFAAHVDSLVESRMDSSRMVQTNLQDTTRRKKSGGGIGLEDIISGKNRDSLIYDVRAKKVYIYSEGDVNYQDMNLKAEYMQMDMSTKEIYAYGKADTVQGEPSIVRPVFTQGSTSYTMDTITYNISSSKAKIKGVATQEGDGWLVGGHVKKMKDNTINIMDGKYTTCDHTDHPHFYLAMTKAKVIPGKKVVTGPAYFVLEDVPIYFLGIPEGFFPISSGPKSGLLMPTYGEDATKGFFFRDLGYYFTFKDYMDLAIRGGIYTLGSWEASAVSRYMKRYKFNGSLNFQYSNIKVGDKGEPDYLKQNNFSLKWTHTQDPKANPGSTFSASVNFATSGYSRYSATNLNDMLSTQTNSSISYSKSWAGTPFSLSANMSVSQNSQNQTISVTLPTIVFNVARIYPFKRKEAMGKARWYEKISMQYSAKMTNSLSTTESEIFSSESLDKMKHGVEHKIPVSASFNLFNYINISPSFNYTERWYFKKQERQWNPQTNQVDYLDPQYGFWRIYDYSTSLSASTTIYGMYRAKNKRKQQKLQAVRHTLTPTIGMSYTPDFKDMAYGYYKVVQSDSTGKHTVYSPFADNAYGVPSNGLSASMNFSLSQNLEMKVLSKRDTSGIRKIKLIDDFRISGSYNFAADSMNLSNISLSFRTTLFGNFGLNLNATLDPYRVTPEGKRINKLFFPGRIVSTGWSFGYSFQSRQDKSQPAINDITTLPPEYQNPFYDPYGQMDPVLRRQYMAQAYYDFSIPWNLSFNYNVSYSVSYVNNGTTGIKRNVNQTLGFNGSINITPKMGLTFQGGFDLMTRKLTTSQISITRDLHCWQMSFNWVPFGHYKSWSFNIGIKAASLADLKYDKSQSMYENMY